ncbi:MAG: serine acetyltransferase [Kiritimatiellaeota bacterium]|nr:serine acetyltransferase [Kiritimatiellota bacterium]
MMKRCSNENLLIEADDAFLDDMVASICATYEDSKGINHIEGFNLPNKSEVEDILSNLMEIVFPGFAGKKILSLRTVKYNVGETLSDIYTKLSDQIMRAMRYNCAMDHCDDCDTPALTEHAVRSLISALPEIRDTMKLDVRAAYDGDPAAKSLDEIILSYPGVKAITIQRFAHILYLENVPLIPRILCEYAHSTTGIDIHPGARLGEAVFIDHGTGVVVGETTVLGDNVKLYQGVTLGALSFPKDSTGKIIKGAKRHPTLENNVTVYAGATILGDIVIGEDSVIGGNVWLTESCAPDSKITIQTPDLKKF